MAEELYFAAYVIAFSIVEDRLFAMYAVCKKSVEGVQEVQRNYRSSLLDCVNYLIEKKHLEGHMKPVLEEQFDLRNKRFHGAMWRLDEFTKENTQIVVDLARKMTDLRTKQKQNLGIPR